MIGKWVQTFFFPPIPNFIGKKKKNYFKMNKTIVPLEK